MVAVAPDPEARARAAGALKEAGVQTSLHYPSVPTFEAFRAGGGEGLPLSEQYGRRTLTLPLYPTLAADDIEFICSILRNSADPQRQRSDVA
jgi:dTDP-4-amino-4,6-dideoxygalactose transaminase